MPRGKRHTSKRPTSQGGSPQVTRTRQVIGGVATDVIEIGTAPVKPLSRFSREVLPRIQDLHTWATPAMDEPETTRREARKGHLAAAN
jgi:hypothetical protein